MSEENENLVQLQLQLLRYQQLQQQQNHQAAQSVFYPTAPGALNVGKFPNPQAVIRLLGNNVEAQKFLSRKAQVIIRMRGLPYDATAKQVVSARDLYLKCGSFFYGSTKLRPPGRARRARRVASYKYILHFSD